MRLSLLVRKQSRMQNIGVFLKNEVELQQILICGQNRGSIWWNTHSSSRLSLSISSTKNWYLMICRRREQPRATRSSHPGNTWFRKNIKYVNLGFIRTRPVQPCSSARARRHFRISPSWTMIQLMEFMFIFCDRYRQKIGTTWQTWWSVDKQTYQNNDQMTMIQSKNGDSMAIVHMLTPKTNPIISSPQLFGFIICFLDVSCHSRYRIPPKWFFVDILSVK